MSISLVFRVMSLILTWRGFKVPLWSSHLSTESRTVFKYKSASLHWDSVVKSAARTLCKYQVFVQVALVLAALLLAAHSTAG